MAQFSASDPYVGQFWIAAAVLVSKRPPTPPPTGTEDDRRKALAEATGKMAVELITEARKLDKWTVE